MVKYFFSSSFQMNMSHILLFSMGLSLGLAVQLYLSTRCMHPVTSTYLSASYEANRVHWSPVYLGKNTILCQVLGHKMFLDTRDIGIVPHLCTSGIWESHIESVFRRTVKPGWRVIDAGANFGYYSMLLATLIGQQGSGIAIEAIPEIYSLLSSTIEVNGYSNNIKVMNYAAFDQKTTLTFNVRPSRKLNSHFVKIEPNVKDNFTIQVPATTIDAIIAEQWQDGIVNFIKIDVEGAEARAWKGLQETLRKNKNNIVIIIEVNTIRLKSIKEDSKSKLS